MAFMRTWLAVVGCVWLLSGCSALSHDEEVEPAALQPLEQQIKLQTLWSRNLAGYLANGEQQIRPAFLGDRIYSVSYRGALVAASAVTGKELWRQELAAKIAGGVATGDGKVIVTTFDGRVLVRSALDGEPLWEARLSSEAVAPSAIGGGLVVVQTIDGRLTAFAGESGELRWSYSAQKPSLTLRGTSAPLIRDDRVYAGFSSGKVVALRLADGEFVWDARVAVPEGQTELERVVDVDGELVPGNGVLYVTSYQGRLATLAMSDGRVLWSRELSSYRNVVDNGEQVFALSAEGRLVAYDKLSSTELWTQEGLYFRQPTAPLYFEGLVVVGDYEGFVHFISPQDGRFVGRFRADEYGLAGPLVQRAGVLYVLTHDGQVIALKLQS